MEEKYKDYTMVILSAALLVSLGLTAMPDANYYCESRELKAYCFNLSSTGKTCYTLPDYQGGKRCTEGWKEIEMPTETTTTTAPPVTTTTTTGPITGEIFANGKWWTCDGTEPYSKCYSGKFEANYGELI